LAKAGDAASNDAASNVTKLEAEERVSFFAFCLRQKSDIH